MRRQGLVLPVLLVAAWQFGALLAGAKGLEVTSPLDVLRGLADLVKGGMPPGHRLPKHVLYSLVRVFLGYSAAIASGVPLGLALGASARVRAFIRPLVDFFRPIPPLAWVPLAIPWFGIGVTAAAFIIFLGAFFPLVLNSAAGVNTLDPVYVDAARTLDASRLQIWTKVLVPGAMPCILTGLRVALGIAWMTLVAAEYTDVREGYGLGYMVMAARDLQRTDVVLAGMLVIGVTGLALEVGLRAAARRILRWK